MPVDLNDLYYFAKVVEHQGFAPAGRALAVPKSKLSRRVALLEAQLGVRLIQRSTRRFSVTPLGQNYYAHCAAMLAEAEAAQSAIDEMRAEPSGLVRMTCPVALLHARIGQMVADFMVKHPKVILHLEASNRSVDVIGEGVDIAIRVRPPPLQDSDLAMRVLTERVWCVVASPALLASYGAITTPAELERLPTLDLGPAQAQHLWQLAGPKGAQVEFRHVPRMVTDDMTVLLNAAVAGAGVVCLPTMIVSDALRDGLLTRLVPDWAPKGGIVHAVYPSRRGLLPSVRALIDYLAMRFTELEEE
ncbi:LysR family transcriptional regulator [Massilia terrae]|uniref:LysR family transcriptional regulator n=1 Tax=Massilia terrae TaxID=1811224 RepID=A0ABT2CRQ0_9BURK|nr:LysR family transcriptional regulator [Massilia terrae]MCS0656636.1 LysR family transcriptional regulator [Massilia terrae]